MGYVVPDVSRGMRTLDRPRMPSPAIQSDQDQTSHRVAQETGVRQHTTRKNVSLYTFKRKDLQQFIVKLRELLTRSVLCFRNWHPWVVEGVIPIVTRVKNR